MMLAIYNEIISDDKYIIAQERKDNDTNHCYNIVYFYFTGIRLKPASPSRLAV